MEWEGADVRSCTVSGLPADLYLNPEDGPKILVWTDGARNAAFWITAALDEGDLIRIAESIRESEPLPRRYRVTWLPLQYGGYYLESETEEGGKRRIRVWQRTGLLYHLRVFRAQMLRSHCYSSVSPVSSSYSCRVISPL